MEKTSFEKNNPQVCWDKVFSKSMYLGLSPKGISLDYRIFVNGLPTLDKFKNTKNNCYMCKKMRENRNHIFVECEMAKSLLEYLAHKSVLESTKMNVNSIIYHLECNSEEIKILTAFESTMWKFRGMACMSKNKLSYSILKRLFHKESQNLWDDSSNII